MKLKDEKAYQDWKDKQREDDDPMGVAYGLACFSYAERWAELMEAALERGEKLEDVASKLSDEANEEGITGFMYGMAVSILARCWVHGEELRRWHNLRHQIGTEGEKANETGGVLNPALLNLGPKDAE